MITMTMTLCKSGLDKVVSDLEYDIEIQYQSDFKYTLKGYLRKIKKISDDLGGLI